jgi:small conductance mechanosensitive channel
VNHKRIFRHWIVQFWLSVTIAALVVLSTAVAWGQNNPPAIPGLPKIELPSTASTTITTAAIKLDGRELFTIAAPTVPSQPNQTTTAPPIQERVRFIETALSEIATNQFDPKTLKVTAEVDAKSGQPIISVNDRYLMTVTDLDAELQGQDSTRRANELTQIIQTGLLEANRERQPNYLWQQVWLTGQILVGLAIVSLALVEVQKRAQRQRQTTAEVAPPSTEALNTFDPTNTTGLNVVKTQINHRQRRNLNDVKRRLLQLTQATIWGGGAYVIFGLFPYTRGLQSIIFSRPLKILAIALIAYGIIRICNVLLDRFFSALAVEDFVAPEQSQRLALRVSTFSRVLRSVVVIVGFGVAVLTILGAIGVDLAPVLAGAGILGLGISFASQNLIKDMINGMLILYEDQYAVGDVIQVGKVSGLVEYMNLRITQLRNEEGRLITIPNSAITIVENLSKDWSRVNLAITLAHDVDIDRAINVIKQVGEVICRDPIWQSKIPEPPDVLGIDDIGNAGITIRIWIKTKPLEQWSVAREFRRRLKLALDAAGIAIGLPLPFGLPNGELASQRLTKE